MLNQAIIKREFALSGSEQNPDLTNKDWRQTLGRAFSKTATGPVEAFKKHGADFVIKDNLADLVAGMNALTAAPLLEFATVEREVIARDRQLDNPFGKDSQLAMIRQARKYRGRQADSRGQAPRAYSTPKHGPLIAVKLNILTRKTLGGFETDLSARVFGTDGAILPGLYAVGEAAGFGGGGVHGYRALEGTFPGRLYLLRPQRRASRRGGCLKRHLQGYGQDPSPGAFRTVHRSGQFDASFTAIPHITFDQIRGGFIPRHRSRSDSTDLIRSTRNR